MNMFCFQCQEAAKGIGCTVKGTCGKEPYLANMQDMKAGNIFPNAKMAT